MTIGELTSRLSEIKSQPWHYWPIAFCVGFVGLFFYDLAWRGMDFIIDHGLIHWFPWLNPIIGDN